jgi:hypothetical protein
VWLEALADELLNGARRHRSGVDTRRRRRVTAKIGRLAEVFGIAFARNPLGKRADSPVRIAFDFAVYDYRTRCRKAVDTRGFAVYKQVSLTKKACGRAGRTLDGEAQWSRGC